MTALTGACSTPTTQQFNVRQPPGLGQDLLYISHIIHFIGHLLSDLHYMDMDKAEVTEVVSKLEKGWKSTAQTMNVKYPDIGHTPNFSRAVESRFRQSSTTFVLKSLYISSNHGLWAVSLSNSSFIVLRVL